MMTWMKIWMMTWMKKWMMMTWTMVDGETGDGILEINVMMERMMVTGDTDVGMMMKAGGKENVTREEDTMMMMMRKLLIVKNLLRFTLQSNEKLPYNLFYQLNSLYVTVSLVQETSHKNIAKTETFPN